SQGCRRRRRATTRSPDRTPPRHGGGGGGRGGRRPGGKPPPATRRGRQRAGTRRVSRDRRALDRGLALHPHQARGLAAQSYLTGFITNQLVDEYGAERVRRGGLRIYTTLDSKMQKAATSAILGTLDRKHDPAGSVVSID